VKILFVASEVAPLAKTGGLADVTGSLARELHRQGHDVRLVVPRYRHLGSSGTPIRTTRIELAVSLGSSRHPGQVRQTKLDGVPVYLLDNPEFFDRDHLYGPPAGDYPDNHQRFAFFCRGVLALLRALDWQPDVLHCHDWQAALVPIILRYELSRDPFFAATATLFTIHNLAFQGLFPRPSLEEMGLNRTCYRIERLEYYDQVNLLKGALLTADLLTTVSPTYRQEILTPEFGCGLDGVLEKRQNDLVGILNGIDQQEWDPATDRYLAQNYDLRRLAARAANKRRLQEQLGLAVAADVPLLGMVSRLTAQKGVDLITGLLGRLAKQGIQLAVLGTGEEKFERIFRARSLRGTRNVAFITGFQPHLAPLIYAGADLFLMPSRFEPCGISQMIALRYGAVPVVRRTGGLADTVFDLQTGGRQANGFSFDECSADALWETLRRALTLWRDPPAWRRLMRTGMRVDYSWHRSAGEYLALYGRAVAKKQIGIR
jgi:starch synthase